MNKNMIKGKMDQAMGKAKETLGEAFANEKLAESGIGQSLKGKAESATGQIQDKLKNVGQSASDKVGEAVDSLTDRIKGAGEEE